jgi:hypothetical protein
MFIYQRKFAAAHTVKIYIVNARDAIIGKSSSHEAEGHNKGITKLNTPMMTSHHQNLRTRHHIDYSKKFTSYKNFILF